MIELFFRIFWKENDPPIFLREPLFICVSVCKHSNFFRIKILKHYSTVLLQCFKDKCPVCISIKCVPCFSRANQWWVLPFFLLLLCQRFSFAYKIMIRLLKLVCNTCCSDSKYNLITHHNRIHLFFFQENNRTLLLDKRTQCNFNIWKIVRTSDQTSPSLAERRTGH